MFTKEENGGKSYLQICRTGYDKEFAGIAQYNRIDGLLFVQQFCIDGESVFRYDITGLISMRDYFSGNFVTEEIIKDTLYQIRQIIIEAEDWLIYETEIFYTPDTIFFRDEKVYLPWLPGAECNRYHQLEEISEFLMQKISPDNRQTAHFIYRLYRSSKLREFSWDKFMGDSASVEGKMENRIVYSEQGPIQSDKREYKEEYEEGMIRDRKKFFLSFCGVCSLIIIVSVLVAKSGLLQSPLTGKWEYTKVLAYFVILLLILSYTASKTIQREKREYKQEVSGEETAILEDYCMNPELYLIPIKSENTDMRNCSEEAEGQVIRMNEFPFSVGKDERHVQGVIDRRGVSRIHGTFVLENKEVYYLDNHSTNGTKINGKRILPDEKYRIEEGNRIEFADSVYTVQLPELTKSHTSY